MFLLDNQPLAIDVAFTHNGLQYPANWLRLTTLEEKQAIGITEVTDPARYDDRFYWGVGNPKDLETIKTNMVLQVKTTAGTLLAPTDWKVIRSAEGVKACDQETLDARTAIRTASNANEALVTACTTVDELAAVQFTWPEPI